MKKVVCLLCVAFATHLLLLVPEPICCSASAPVTRNVSLAVAETFHYRLNVKSNAAGATALYRGSLAYQYGLGAMNPGRPGWWDVYPVEKLIRGDFFKPDLAQPGDSLFSIQLVDKPTSDSISLIVCGETVGVSIHGAAKNWKFPRSAETTVESLIEHCSDKYWGGLEKRKESEKGDRKRKGSKEKRG